MKKGHSAFSWIPWSRKKQIQTPFFWKFHFWRIWLTITTPIRAIGKFLARIFTIYRVAVLLALVSVVLWNHYQIDFEYLVPNIITDLLGVTLAIFIIDTMYKLRSNAERKKVLIAKLGSKINAVATEALYELNAEGWLSDGSLQHVFLLSCNLSGNTFTGADFRQAIFSFGSLRDTTWFETDLRGASLDHTDFSNATLSMPADIPNHYIEADLTGATLSETNLTGAKVRHEQLCRANSLHGATMPDGQLYDGRYNLPVDEKIFLKIFRNPINPMEWAKYYDVSLDRYLEGQKWAKENLSRLRQKFSV